LSWELKIFTREKMKSIWSIQYWVDMLWYGYMNRDDRFRLVEDILTKESEETETNKEDGYSPYQLNPLIVHINEKEIYERNKLYDLLMKNKDYFVIRFYIHRYYSNYLLSYFVLDLLDLLSNEGNQIQTKFEFVFEWNDKKKDFINEFKMFLKNKTLMIQSKKFIPIYSNFLEPVSFPMEYSILSNHQFNVLFVKETIESFFIQRIYFSIDI
jgi:hypothetical protein